MANQADKLRDEKSCPLPSAHTRLRQAHELWHRTVSAYADPDDFVLALNQLLVTLRQVTFMVQKQRATIPDFERWYEKWRQRMQDDPLMVWLRDARNHVEKKGDLDLASTAKVTVIASWLETPYREFEVPPLMGPDEIAETVPVKGLPSRLRDEGIIQVERRWVSRDLPDHELTEVCAHGYGVLSTFLADAHQRLGFRMRTFSGETHAGQHHRTEHLGGRLPCMLLTAEMRTAHLHLSSGRLVSIKSREVPFDPADEGRIAEWARAVPIAPGALEKAPSEDPLEWGARWSAVAGRVLAHDGFHVPLACLFDRDGKPLGNVRMQFADQAEKYLAFRRLGDHVNRLGAYTVILINEMWEAHVPIEEVGPAMQRAGERADRTEALVVMVATADGRHRSYHTPFTRDQRGRPILARTEILDQDAEFAPSLEPLRKVWRTWR